VVWTLFVMTLLVVVGQYWGSRRWQYAGAY
jgi:hypothetical protein